MPCASSGTQTHLLASDGSSCTGGTAAPLPRAPRRSSGMPFSSRCDSVRTSTSSASLPCGRAGQSRAGRIRQQQQQQRLRLRQGQRGASAQVAPSPAQQAQQLGTHEKLKLIISEALGPSRDPARVFLHNVIHGIFWTPSHEYSCPHLQQVQGLLGAKLARVAAKDRLPDKDCRHAHSHSSCHCGQLGVGSRCAGSAHCHRAGCRDDGGRPGAL